MSDWKTGEAIPGGEALDDAEFVKKTIADVLAANKTDIELTLPASAGEDVFNAIREALSSASEGSIDLRPWWQTRHFPVGLPGYQRCPPGFQCLG